MERVKQTILFSMNRNADSVIGRDTSREALHSFCALLCFLWLSLLALGQYAQAAPRWEAYAGEPFGVGRVTVDVVRGEPALPLSDERFTVVEAGGRALYPVLKKAPVRRIIRRLLEIETPASVSIYFLFQGGEPYELQTYAPSKELISITPKRNPRAHRQLMDQWWNEYSGRLKNLQRDPEFPPVVENFITATLAWRLERKMPEAPSGLLPWNKKKVTAWDELFAGETYRLQLDRELAGGLPTQQQGDLQPLPNPIAWSPPSFSSEDLDEVPVEAIAAHVPEECFYLRFGTFTNYLWFRDLNKKWQGDLQNMILRRGIDSRAAQRIQQQLSLRESALAKILGPQVIEDVAIVGLDFDLAHGAAIGILFQAKNSFLLARDLNSKRREALEKFPDATETEVKIAEHDVSLIASPDGKVRSYYAQDGDFHLVTTSRSLVERFFRAGGGERSLALSDGFRHARRELPLERHDAVFAYVSSAFFQQWCAPENRIESRRRLRSDRELKLLELARFMAVAEGIPPAGHEDLIRAGLLPNGFGQRADGSQLQEDDGGGLDTRRGQSGYFLPLADMEEVDGASAEEVAAFRRFSARLREDIGQLSPLAAGIRRVPRGENPGGHETMVADVRLLHTTGMKLGSWTKNLGEPNSERLAPVPDDVGSFEAVLDIPVPLIGGEKQPHHLFGGLRDFRSPLTVGRGVIKPDAPTTELIRGYLGAWPRPGILEIFGGRSPTTGVEPEQVGEQVWQAGRDEFLLLSFKPDVIEKVLPQLAIEPAERPAQIRLRIDDLTGKQIAETINALGYGRARETSAAASRLMNTLANQLHVPRPDCREVAERLVDGHFVCPLGGEYQLFEPPSGLLVWASSALPEANRFLLTDVPDDFQLPMLGWFRGLHGELHMADREMAIHLEIDLATGAIPE